MANHEFDTSMTIFSLIPGIGGPISVKPIGCGRVDGRVPRAGGGKLGVSLAAPLE